MIQTFFLHRMCSPSIVENTTKEFEPMDKFLLFSFTQMYSFPQLLELIQFQSEK